MHIFGSGLRIMCFLLLLFAMGSCTQRGHEEASLSGMLENADETLIEYTYFREYLNNDRVVIGLEPDADNVFSLSIQLDKPLLGWLRAEIEGVHFNTPGRERGVPALYNVKWIPSFYVIGRDGNIFDNRPPMPSSGQLQDLLLDALGTES